MPLIPNPSPTAQYFDASERIHDFVEALIKDASLVEAPEARFQELNELAEQTGRRFRNDSNPLIVPELLSAKIFFARGVLDLSQGNSENAQASFESMICMADTANAIPELDQWLGNGISARGRIYESAMELTQLARERISTFENLEPPFSILTQGAGDYPEEAPAARSVARRGAEKKALTLGEVKDIDQRIEPLVKLIGGFENSAGIDELFGSIFSELGEAGRRIYAAQDPQVLHGLGLIDAKLHLLRYEIEKERPEPDAARLEYYRTHVEGVTEHAGCHEALHEWKVAVNQAYPKLFVDL